MVFTKSATEPQNYTMLVINQDWPLMQHQEASEPAWTALGKLRNDILRSNPSLQRYLPS
jgi:hypothetical protein